MKGGESWVQGADPRYPHHCGKTFLASEKRRVPGVTLGFCPSALFGPPLQSHKALPAQWPSTLLTPSVQSQEGTGSWRSSLPRPGRGRDSRSFQGSMDTGVCFSVFIPPLELTVAAHFRGP